MHVKLPATKIFVTKYFNAFLCKSISKKSHQFFFTKPWDRNERNRRRGRLKPIEPVKDTDIHTYTCTLITGRSVIYKIVNGQEGGTSAKL